MEQAATRPENSHREIRDMNDATTQYNNPADIISVTIHPGVTVVEGVFSQYKNLRSIVLFPRVTIGSNAFKNCRSLTSIFIHQEVMIGLSAFSNCTSLTSIVIHQGVTIKSCAFSNCASLTSVVIHQGANLGWLAFNNCTSLTSVVIHQGGGVERGAFYGCTSLRSMYVMCRSENEQAIWTVANPARKFPPGVTFTFVQERAIISVINNIKMHHLSNPCLELRVYPNNLAAIMGQSQITSGSQPSALSASNIHNATSELQYNNFLAVQPYQRQLRQMREYILTLFLSSARAGLDNEKSIPLLPKEIWELILSYIVYQDLMPRNFVGLMKSLFSPEYVGRNKNELVFNII